MNHGAPACSVPEAQGLLERSVNDLLADLAKVDDMPAPIFLGADDLDPDSSRYFKLYALWKKYQKKVCKDSSVKKIVLDRGVDGRIQLVCAIADLLKFEGAATFAALVVKESLYNSCRAIWEDYEAD